MKASFPSDDPAARGRAAGQPHATPPRWAERWADHPAGPALLALAAVLEACLFPAPTEALLVALSLGRPRRSWRLAALAVAASLVGALAAYAIGWYQIGDPGSSERMMQVGEAYHAGAFWLLATSGYTPIPYLVYTTAAGVYHVPLGPFIAGALVGRTLKYFLLGTLTFYLGPPLRRFLVRHRAIVTAVFVTAAFAGIALLLRWITSR